MQQWPPPETPAPGAPHEPVPPVQHPEPADVPAEPGAPRSEPENAPDDTSGTVAP